MPAAKPLLRKGRCVSSWKAALTRLGIADAQGPARHRSILGVRKRLTHHQQLPRVLPDRMPEFRQLSLKQHIARIPIGHRQVVRKGSDRPLEIL